MGQLSNYLCFTILLVLSVSHIEGKKIPCPPLPLTPGVVVSCELPKENKKIACTGPIEGVPKRTVAKYKCEGDTDFSETLVECKCYGKWKGLDEFQTFTSICDTVQKNFSLSGPPELNLTKAEIQFLDGNITSNSSNSGNRNSIPEYALDALAYHNLYRRKHGAAPLKLNETLSKAAYAWAEHSANSGTFEPQPWSMNKTFISNMYELTLDTDDFDLAMAARLAVGKWYASSKDYDYDLPVANALMWNSTTDLGVGVVSNGGGSVWVVCNYYPPGNVYYVNSNDSLALFRTNVFQPVVNSTKSGQ